MKSVIDLHCDLLGCINFNPKLSFDSPEVNCSIPQLLEGKVSLQTLAIASITEEGSAKRCAAQLQLYKNLLDEKSGSVFPFSEWREGATGLHFILAIENASVIAEEHEPLERAFDRYEMLEDFEELLYLSLTWNHENRFGGGNASKVGLKPDGKALLEFLSGRRVAIDLSHTSDALASDILNTIDKEALEITPIASHSNFRGAWPHERNLPDEIAQEIAKRGGLIGLNFVRRFIGDHDEDFLKQIEYGSAIGCADALALGADFYGALDLPPSTCPGRTFPTFPPQYSNSSTYPSFIALVERNFGAAQSEALASGNATRFIEKLKCTP